MIHLRNSPLLWLALVLLTACITAGKIGPLTLAGTLALVGLALICALAAVRRYDAGRPYISTIAIGGLFFSSGILRVSEYTGAIYTGEALAGSHRMEGLLTVSEVLKRKAHGITLSCKPVHLHAQDTTGLPVFKDRNILVQVNEADSLSVFPGDMITATGWVSALPGPFNPRAFDLRGYYHTMGIRHRMTVKGHEISIMPVTQFSLMRLPARWQYALSSLVHRHTSPEVAQLTNALVWGDRSDMDQAVIDAFADSGAMHVLSVSGMHVAIIYSMLYFLLGPPGKGSFRRRMIRLAVYILAILLYMALTGASAAVVRAGWMIILFLTGKAMGWNTQIWNILGFSACLMLWLNPFIWQNIGFQLSFLAMAGLLLFTRPVTRYLTFKNKLLQWTWEITAVSIAAQVFIVPLLLLYFHQFPLTFAASSLVAMPAGYIIIFGALLNVLLSAVGIHFLWPVFDIAGEYFILSMKWLAEINPSMHYAMPSLAGYLLMGMAIVFSAAFVYNWPKGRQIAYACGLASLLTLFVHRTIQWNHDDLIVYHTYQGLLVDIILDGQCLSIQDTALTPQAVKFAARGYRSYRDIIHTVEIKKENHIRLPRGEIGSSALLFPGASVLFLDDTLDETDENEKFTHIVVQTCQNIKKTIALISQYRPRVIVLPAHIRGYEKYAILKMADEHTIAVHDISKQGYFRLTL